MPFYMLFFTLFSLHSSASPYSVEWICVEDINDKTMQSASGCDDLAQEFFRQIGCSVTADSCEYIYHEGSAYKCRGTSENCRNTDSSGKCAAGFSAHSAVTLSARLLAIVFEIGDRTETVFCKM